MTPRANRLTPRAKSEVSPAPLTPATCFQACVDAFERLGYDVDSLLAGVGIRRADLLDPDALIPAAVCGGFFGSALQRMRPTNIGVRVAEVTPIGAFPLLDYLVVRSERVGDGCRQLSRYLRLVEVPTWTFSTNRVPCACFRQRQRKREPRLPVNPSGQAMTR